jgi:hypothetical protein
MERSYHFWRLPGCVCLLLLATLGHAWAEDYGYGFVGGMFLNESPGTKVRYGLGGEAAVLPHLTLGGELGGVHHGMTGLVASGNVGLHFRRGGQSGYDPFITGGVTGVYGNGEAAVFTNVGGGSNYWFHRRVGVRAEFRGYVGGEDSNSFTEVRFGICFRLAK